MSNMDFNEAQDWVRSNRIQLASLLSSVNTATFVCGECGMTEEYPSTVTACVCNSCRKPMEYKGITALVSSNIDGYEIIIRGENSD